MVSPSRNFPSSTSAGQRVFDAALDGAPQRASAQRRVEAFFRELLDQLVADDQFHPLRVAATGARG